jgi:hypothetical protein
LECQYSLMSFGISRHILPVDAMGKLHCRGLLQFLETLHIQEEIDKQKRVANEAFLQAQEEKEDYYHHRHHRQEESGLGRSGASVVSSSSLSSSSSSSLTSISARATTPPLSLSTTTTTTATTTTNGHTLHRQPSATTNTIDLDDMGRIMVAVATQKDVLFGRGKPYQVHPGNIRLAELIEERQVEYNRSDRINKTRISWEIVTIITQQEGGRFLKKEDATDSWEQVRYAVAREKVAHGFRTPHRSGAGSAPTVSSTTQKASSSSSSNGLSSSSSSSKRATTKSSTAVAASTQKAMAQKATPTAISKTTRAPAKTGSRRKGCATTIPIEGTIYECHNDDDDDDDDNDYDEKEDDNRDNNSEEDIIARKRTKLSLKY